MRGQSQCKGITYNLTIWSSKVPEEFDLLCNTWKKLRKISKMLNMYYQIPISVLNPLKQWSVQIKNDWKEPVNLMRLQCQVKWKALHILLVCVNEYFKNQLLIDVQLIEEPSWSPR